MTEHTPLRLNGFTFAELLQAEGLNRLDKIFLDSLETKKPTLFADLIAYRTQCKPFRALEKSELLIQAAQFLEIFLADFFNIQEAFAISQIKTTSQNPISIFKKYFVLRRAKKELTKADTFPPFNELNDWLQTALKKAALKSADQEMAIALLGTEYLEKPDIYAVEIEKLVAWCVRALTTQAMQGTLTNWISFKLPARIDLSNLIEIETVPQDPFARLQTAQTTLRFRDGFALTDPRMNRREVQDEVNYCIDCHDHDGDFCSKGFPVKKNEPALGFKKNALDVTLTGCPLEEKISEMNYLKKSGHTLAALAMVMVDNPMCPATGHRICNDCMKACIYQKQDPVNIPQIETRVLTDVLDLPWGVEIYDLLTRWNPLRQTQWVMKPYNGLKVMIAGMGPAGFTLAHHLLQEGFAVVGFDGLKIEPLPAHFISSPVERFSDLKESLDERLMAGFGGVAEYGITVRWDKNFLKLIYLSLLRRPYFQVFGSVRFGGTITIDDAWDMGFDHFVVAVGAGLPKALSIPQSMAPGMRQANDFLMALQLGNAAKKSSMTNLQIRMPAVVIGGGLTGVDTATEVQAYYIMQVEKILARYETLTQTVGEAVVLQQFDAADIAILQEYLAHGRAVRAERNSAQAEKRPVNFIQLLRSFGGVTIAYRRSIQESPAYIHNHEELQKAFQEGIYYAEGLEPASVELDAYGNTAYLVCKKRKHNDEKQWTTTEEEIKLPAHTILVATGTQPNTAYEFEHRGTFNRLHLQYQHYEEDDGELIAAHGVEHCKDEKFGPFTSYHKHDKRVSLIGDTHPVFHGNVVKAIASGMRTYPKILKLLKHKLNQVGDEKEYQSFAEHMRYLFSSKVIEITRKTNDKLELTIQAPLAAKHFKAGQFYRLQNFETYAPKIQHTLLQMEPLALVTADHDKEKGLLHFIVTEKTASAKLCATLKPGEIVSLMGPTGARSKIPSEHETVLIIGDASSFAFVRSFGNALKTAGNNVLYLCQVHKAAEVFCQEKLENVCDAIIWSTHAGDAIPASRSCDASLTHSNVVNTFIAYAKNHLIENPKILLQNVDRIFIVGDTNLLREFQTHRKELTKDYLAKDPTVFGSVYGNMQCMLKGVCAQCLQWQIDPETGKRTKAVFACSWQDQPLEIIDIDHIDERAKQNSLLDKISNLWIDYLFTKFDIARV